MLKSLFAILICASYLYAKPIAYEVKPNSFKSGNSVYMDEGKSIRLKFDVQNAKSIKWYQIIPDVDTMYKNANFPWDPNPYKWIGFGKIEYKSVELEQFQNQKIITITPNLLQANRPSGYKFYRSNVGSFWFKAVATLQNGKVVKSPDTITYRGLSPKVFRVLYREDRGYIGMLTTFFNVPALFGSVPYQSTHYIGVDCADSLMAVSSLMNKTKMPDINVATMVTKLPHQASFKIAKGEPNKKLRWGKEFRRGDFLAVKYNPKSRFAHIGLLYRDANGNGVLDKEDLILHTGPLPLDITPLSKGAFDGMVRILRNRDLRRGR